MKSRGISIRSKVIGNVFLFFFVLLKRKQRWKIHVGREGVPIRLDLKHPWARTSWEKAREREIRHQRPWQRHGGASGDVSGVLNEIRFARVYLRPTHFLPPCRERNVTSDLWLLMTFYVYKIKTSDPWTKRRRCRSTTRSWRKSQI